MLAEIPRTLHVLDGDRIFPLFCSTVNIGSVAVVPLNVWGLIWQYGGLPGVQCGTVRVSNRT